MTIKATPALICFIVGLTVQLECVFGLTNMINPDNDLVMMVHRLLNRWRVNQAVLKADESPKMTKVLCPTKPL